MNEEGNDFRIGVKEEEKIKKLSDCILLLCHLFYYTNAPSVLP